MFGPDNIDWAQLAAPFRVEFGVLTLVRFAASADPPTPLASWPEPFAPTYDLGRCAVMEADRTGLLRIDGELSALTAFDWDPDEARGRPPAIRTRCPNRPGTGSGRRTPPGTRGRAGAGARP